MTALPPNTTPVQAFSHWAIHHHAQIEQWFRYQYLDTPPPFYASVDLRNSEHHLAPVDTNLFPAGFNNLSPNALPLLVQAFSTAMTRICPNVGRILLIPENHTRNLYYLANLGHLAQALAASGVELRLGSLDPTLTEPRVIPWGDLPASPASGGKVISDRPPLVIEPIVRERQTLMLMPQPSLGLPEFRACVVLLNNDLSGGLPEMLVNLEQQILPPPALGWFQRKKSDHFRHYRKVVGEFSSAFGLDEAVLHSEFVVVDGVDFHEPKTLEPLALACEALLAKLRADYQTRRITRTPYVVIKADSGTYGMAVMTVKSGDEVRQLNRKARNKLAVGKEGMKNHQLMVQEGIHSSETVDGHTAEQTLYIVGQHVVGGFYRLHADKDETGILNAPGMEFRDLPFTECCHMPDPQRGIADGCNRHYVAGLVARLASLAAAREALGILG